MSCVATRGRQRVRSCVDPSEVGEEDEDEGGRTCEDEEAGFAQSGPGLVLEGLAVSEEGLLRCAGGCVGVRVERGR